MQSMRGRRAQTTSHKFPAFHFADAARQAYPSGKMSPRKLKELADATICLVSVDSCRENWAYAA
jgi:hypothetical protein